MFLKHLKFALGLTLISLTVKAQGLVAPSSSENYLLGEVAVEQTEDVSTSYKQRRAKHGALFSVNLERFYPLDYRSLFGDALVEEMIGSDTIDLVGVDLGYKRNLGPMSISILANVASGSIVGAYSGSDRTITMSKYGLSGNIALDGIMQEPIIVPYVQGGAHQFNVSEERSDTRLTQSATTGISMNFKFGVLFQLDWIEASIDKSSKQDRLQSSGLENTYIDIYMSNHMASSDAIDPTVSGAVGDPNLESSGQLGLGLKMEF